MSNIYDRAFLWNLKKCSILDVWKGSECASVSGTQEVFKSKKNSKSWKRENIFEAVDHALSICIQFTMNSLK